MRKTFDTIQDYLRLDPEVRTESLDMGQLRLSVLQEGFGDVTFARTDRQTIVLTLDGTSTHLTRMEGIYDETPSYPGEVCVIPQGAEVHLAWTNAGPVQTSVMVDFDMSFFRAYAPELLTGSFLQGQLVPSSFAALPKLSGLMRVLSREVDPTKSRGRLFADAALRLLAFEIAATAWSVRHVAEQGSERNDPRMGRVLDYIEATFTQDLSVFDLAAVAGLSPTQFNRSFRAATGRSPYAFVVDRRLSHAIQLLLTTDLSLAVVAVDSGFADQAHMTRMMRARYGRTPRQVRSAR